MRLRIATFLPLAGLVFVFIACSGTEETTLISASERFRLGMAEYNDEDYLEALNHFDVIRLQYMGSAVSDSARYFSGMARFKREEYLLASYEFNQVRSSSSSRELSSDAQYMYAESYYMLSPPVPLDQAYTTRAIDALQTFIELYPNHPKVSESYGKIKELYNKLAEKDYRTGVLYTKLDNYPSALVYFENVIDRYYSTDYADDALYEKIRILSRQKNKRAETAAAVKQFMEKFPDSPYKADVQTTIPVDTL